MVLALKTLPFNRRCCICFALILFAFVLAPVSFPQFYLSSGFNQVYDDNIYNSSNKIEDFVSSADLSAGFDFESELNNLEVFYEGEFNYYQKNIEKSSFGNRVGLVNTYLTKDESNPLNIGGFALHQENREGFRVYDYNQYAGYVNYRNYSSETAFIGVGYMLQYSGFKNFSFLTHYEHSLFARGNGQLDSSATFFYSALLTVKAYTLKVDGEGGANTIARIKGSVGAAKPLGENTGLRAELSLFRNLTSGARYQTSGEFVLYEEDILNSLYSFEGYSLEVRLTQLLPLNTMGKLSALFEQRSYTGIPALNRFGEELSSDRSDQHAVFSLEVETDLSDILQDLDFHAAYSYIINTSNDYWYDYGNSVLSIGFQFAY